MADHGRPRPRLHVRTRVQEGRSLRGAHPLVAVARVPGGTDRCHVECQHAGGVSRVHQSLHAALPQVPDQGCYGQDESRLAGHVIE